MPSVGLKEGGEKERGDSPPRIKSVNNYVLSLQEKKGGRKRKEKKNRRRKNPQDRKGQERKG